jgi:hypothetical protein
MYISSLFLSFYFSSLSFSFFSVFISILCCFSFF